MKEVHWPAAHCPSVTRKEPQFKLSLHIPSALTLWCIQLMPELTNQPPHAAQRSQIWCPPLQRSGRPTHGCAQSSESWAAAPAHAPAMQRSPLACRCSSDPRPQAGGHASECQSTVGFGSTWPQPRLGSSTGIDHRKQEHKASGDYVLWVN